MGVGSRITEWRKARGYTQAKLAERAHMSASTIAMYETNRRSPDQAAITKLSGALGIPEALLTGGTTLDAQNPEEGAAPTKRQSSARPTRSETRSDKPEPVSSEKSTKKTEDAPKWVPGNLDGDSKEKLQAITTDVEERSFAAHLSAASDSTKTKTKQAPGGNDSNGKTHTEQEIEVEWTELKHDEPSRHLPSPASGLTELALTRDEAKLILFVRMNPQSMGFFESYIKSNSKRREQLARTWRLINDFQNARL